MNLQQLLALATVLLMTMPTPVWSASVAIGTAAGRGNFELNKKLVAGTGTVRAGDAIATDANGSTVRLTGGTRVDLAPRSAGAVYGDRLVLQSGAAVVRTPQAFGVEAGSLTILPDSSTPGTGTATVSYVGGRRVQVSATGGSYQVKNAQGVLVARVMPGRALVLAPQAGVNTRMVLNGVIERADCKYFITDATAGVKFQLSGSGLDRFAGKQAAVTGSLMEGVAGSQGAARVVAVQLVELPGQAPVAVAAAESGTGDGPCAVGAVVGGGGAGVGAAIAGSVGGAGGIAGMGTGVLAGVGVAAAAGTGLAVQQAVKDDDPKISK